MTRCSADNCQKISYEKGLCTKHYALWLDTGEVPRSVEKDPDAVALGRKGGIKGGPARAKRLTQEKRSEIARNAANARWGNRTPVHGTPSEYSNHGCRCKKCTKAHSLYMAKVMKAPCEQCGKLAWSRYRKSKLCVTCAGLNRRTAKHGSETVYNRGCRCDKCRNASRIARKKRRLRRALNEAMAR